jgi:hypothetical protein
MEHDVPTAVRVTLSGPHLSRETISDALQAVTVDNVEVTWRSAEDVDKHGPWRITVASGHRVAVGALPRGRQTARELAAYLNTLIAGH